jgi:hypothetical protein
MKKQQKKQAGFIVSAELVLIATILVIGLIVGMVTIRNAMTAEMDDVAEAIGALDQSYSFQGIDTDPLGSFVSGTTWLDGVDDLAGDGQQPDFNRTPGDGAEFEADNEF